MKNLTSFLIMLFALCGSAAIGLAQTKKETPIVAVITDDKGLSTTVKGLTAVYQYQEEILIKDIILNQAKTATQNHVSQLPIFSMRITEGRTTFTEEIPFSQIKKIESDIDGYSRVTRLLIEKKDGSSILIAEGKTFEERDGQGNVKRQLKVTEVYLKLPDDKSKLREFVGRATVTGGKEGDFSIPSYSIKSIVFQ